MAHATFIAGGYAVRAASWITLNNTTKKPYITAKTNDGSIYSGNYGSFNNYAVNLSSYVGQPGAVDKAKAGIFGIEKNGFTSITASMSADGILSLNFYFTTSVLAENVRFYYWTAEQYASVSQLTITNASGMIMMIPSSTANMYWANYDGIAAKEMDQPIYACGVYESNGVLYSTGVFSYSLAKYCVTKAAYENNVQDFAAAMIVYGFHAKTYFNYLRNK